LQIEIDGLQIELQKRLTGNALNLPQIKTRIPRQIHKLISRKTRDVSLISHIGEMFHSSRTRSRCFKVAISQEERKHVVRREVPRESRTLADACRHSLPE
jgi:hypothetical protein